MRIRDPGWKKFGSGIWDGKTSGPGIRDGKTSDPGFEIYIPDPQHWYPDQNQWKKFHYKIFLLKT